MKTVPRPEVVLPMRAATVLACSMLTILAGVAYAASDDGHREHAAHEHGRGMLDIVAEGEELVVEFRIPAANVVGFEHAPRNDAEREAVRKVSETFRDPASVLALPAEAECEVEEAEAGIVGMDAGEHDDHAHEGEDHDHDADEHAKETHEDHDHAKEEGEDHDHDHDHGHAKEGHDEHSADSDGEAHSELHAAYHFHCHAPERLVRIEVRVFEHLRDAEEIDVRVVTTAVQTVMELHPGDTVVELSP